MYRYDSYDNSLVIDGFQNGIADSPYSGISDMRNVNITSIPGEASVNFSTASITLGTSSGTVVSADPATDIVTVTVSGGPLQSGQSVVFTGGSLPGGLSAATTYWIVAVSTTTLKVYTNPSLATATLVDIASTGTGTFGTTGTMGKPTAKAFYNNAGTVRYFIIDSAGRVFELNQNFGVAIFLGNDINPDSNNDANGNGLIAYNGYLFIFRNDKIDYIKLSDNSYHSNWQVLSTVAGTNNYHASLQSYNDSKIYFCDSNHIGTFYQNQTSTTFDPSDASTYTYTKAILDLPSNDIAQSISELGTNLMIGGQLNAIYPWNRLVQTAGSAGNLSVLSFYSTPILVAENFISRLVTVNTNTYIFAGIRGRIYVTNGSQASFYKKVPDHISGTVEPYFQWGDATAIKNQLFFGVTCVTNANSANSQYGGVWGIDLDSTALRLAQKLSYGTYAGIASVLLPVLITSSTATPGGTGLYIGWDSGASTFGVDQTQSTPYTNSVSTIDSDLIPIGTYNKARDLTPIEYKLSRPLVSGESIIIRTRLIFNTSDTGYTTTLTDSTIGHYSGSKPINFKQAQWVQFQVLLNSTASTPSFVRLKEIRILGLTAPLAQNS